MISLIRFRMVDITYSIMEKEILKRRLSGSLEEYENVKSHTERQMKVRSVILTVWNCYLANNFRTVSARAVIQTKYSYKYFSPFRTYVPTIKPCDLVCGDGWPII